MVVISYGDPQTFLTIQEQMKNNKIIGVGHSIEQNPNGGGTKSTKKKWLEIHGNKLPYSLYYVEKKKGEELGEKTKWMTISRIKEKNRLAWNGPTTLFVFFLL